MPRPLPHPVCPCLLRPRVLQKITKILFAALQLLAKKNHRVSQRQRQRQRPRGGLRPNGRGSAAAFPFVSLYSHAAPQREREREEERVAWAQRVQHPFPLKSFISHTMPGTFYRCPLQYPSPTSPLLSSHAAAVAMIKYEINF